MGYSLHHQYRQREYDWRTARDAIAGSSSIKRENTLYLPMPSGMEAAIVVPATGVTYSTDPTKNQAERLKTSPPWAHPNKPYQVYLQRARFPELSQKSLLGFLGLATKNPPKIELPTQLKYLINNATTKGESLVDLYKKCVREVLVTGRMPLVLDVLKGNLFAICSYTAESLVDWVTSKTNEARGATFLETREDDGDDEIITERILLLNENDEYSIITQEEDLVVDEVVPSLFGKPLNQLPLVVIGSTDLDLKPDIIPIAGIVDCAIAIYQKNADLSQAEFLTCNPMLVITGATPEESPTVVGSSVAITISDAAGSASYAEPRATSLGHVKGHINDLYDEALGYGMQLLGPNKASQESTDTVRLRQEAAGATLFSIVATVGQGIQKILELAATWSGLNPKEVKFEPSTKFSDYTMDSRQMDSLLKAWMNRGISHDTYLSNLKKASFLPPSRTVDEEMVLIETNNADALQLQSTITPAVPITSPTQSGVKQVGDPELDTELTQQPK